MSFLLGWWGLSSRNGCKKLVDITLFMTMKENNSTKVVAEVLVFVFLCG